MRLWDRLCWIAQHGPIINMTVSEADRLLFSLGLITADRTAVYVSRRGLAWLAWEAASCGRSCGR